MVQRRSPRRELQADAAIGASGLQAKSRVRMANRPAHGRREGATARGRGRRREPGGKNLEGMRRPLRPTPTRIQPLGARECAKQLQFCCSDERARGHRYRTMVWPGRPAVRSASRGHERGRATSEGPLACSRPGRRKAGAACSSATATSCRSSSCEARCRASAGVRGA